VRPIAELELSLNDRGWFADPNPTVLYAQARTVDFTKVLLAEVVHTVAKATHFIAPFEGDTGEGKSYSAMRIASMSRALKYHMLGKTIETHYTWSPIQTAAKAWKGVFHPWDDIIQDEHRKKNIGKGSSTASAMLEGLEQTSLRFDKNNILFCSPVEHTHKYHFAFEALGYEEVLKVQRRTLHNVNILVLIGPRFGLPMGLVYLSDEEWPIDPYIIAKHQSEESTWKLMVKRHGGIPPEVDPDIVAFCEAKLLDHLKTNYPEDMFRMSRLELEKVYSVELRLPALFFMDETLASVQAEIQKMARQRKAEEIAEDQIRIAEHQAEQDTLVDVIAPRVLKYFLQYADDRLGFPNAGAMQDHIRRTYHDLDQLHMKKTIDAVRHLWVKMRSGSEVTEQLKEEVLAPPAVSPADFKTDPHYWFQVVKERYPDLVMNKYWEAYTGYLDHDEEFKSHRHIANYLGLKKSTVTETFQKIEGGMKRLMGYEFERVMAKIYQDSNTVLRIDPPVERTAKEGQPDRIVYLADGSIRVCSWKVANEEESIKVKNSPEIRLTKRLLEEGKDTHMVMEGLFEGRFFSVLVDPEQTKGSVRVRKDCYYEWPPDIPRLLEAQLGRPTADRLELAQTTETGSGGGGGEVPSTVHVVQDRVGLETDREQEE